MEISNKLLEKSINKKTGTKQILWTGYFLEINFSCHKIIFQYKGAILPQELL